MSRLPSTQIAVALSGERQPLIEVSSPVFPAEAGEVVICVHWAASTPIDLHRADGGLLNDFYPCLSGSGGASGTVVAVGSGGDLKGLEVGDRVTTFAFGRSEREANHQQYITVPAFLVSRVPENITLQAAVTVNDSLVTVFHTVTADLGLDLPWPLPKGWEPPQASKPILIWGASSTVGIYALQVLRHWGYRNLLAVSSARHHNHLRSLGATACFDYTQSNAVENVLQHIAGRPVPQVPYIIDCIGSVDNTLRPLTKIAQTGAIVAAMLPFIVRDATEDLEPEYQVDKTKILPGSWAEGVELRGVSTYTYLKNELLKEKLQSDIVPNLLARGIIKPTKDRIVEGASMAERAQNALSLLRNKADSGKRWLENMLGNSGGITKEKLKFPTVAVPQGDPNRGNPPIWDRKDLCVSGKGAAGPF